MIRMNFLTAIYGGLFGLASAASPDAFFQSKTVIIPKDESILKGGEDSADSADGLLTVADGVGGWSLQGVDSGVFSREVTKTILHGWEADKTLTAKELLLYGCNVATALHQGSSTVVVLKLIEQMTLEAANLGDSGFALFRVN